MTSSTRFNSKSFRVLSKNIQPGKLYCTVFHLKISAVIQFYWRRFSSSQVTKGLNF